MGLIGSAIGAAGSIFGGISASKAMKRAKKNVEAQRQKNQDWYDRRYNEDATQRADAQRILTQTEESIKQRNKQAAGSAAVMGGTDESGGCKSGKQPGTRRCDIADCSQCRGTERQHRGYLHGERQCFRGAA